MTAPASRTVRGLRSRVAALRAGGDDGAVSVYALSVILVLMLVAGLVVDGGRAVNARATAADDAEQAARAGAGQVDLGALRADGTLALDPGAAQVAATALLTDRGYDASRISVQVVADEITVAVSRTVPTALLSLAFVHSFDVEGSAVARAAIGVTSEFSGAP